MGRGATVERRDEEHDDGHSEVRYGAFTRSVRLPKGASADGDLLVSASAPGDR